MNELFPKLRLLFVGVALTLKPFGPVGELLKGDKPWHGFSDNGPVLTMFRAQRMAIPAPACKAWVDALEADSIGHELGAFRPEDYAAANPTWGPWKKEELEGIDSCTENPCDVKLSGAEVARMAATGKGARQKEYLKLVFERVRRYQKTQERKEYEFPGDPVDPWKTFEALGLKSPLAIPAKPRFELRKVDFFPGRVKTLRQILDTRVVASADHRQATLWRRDAYTDHYFDSWGEWTDVSCDGSQVTVVQAVMLELDLMKKTDILSKMMRSKMRNAAEENGASYLDHGFERLRARAEK